MATCFQKKQQTTSNQRRSTFRWTMVDQSSRVSQIWVAYTLIGSKMIQTPPNDGWNTGPPWSTRRFSPARTPSRLSRWTYAGGLAPHRTSVEDPSVLFVMNWDFLLTKTTWRLCHYCTNIYVCVQYSYCTCNYTAFCIHLLWQIQSTVS